MRSIFFSSFFWGFFLTSEYSGYSLWIKQFLFPSIRHKSSEPKAFPNVSFEINFRFSSLFAHTLNMFLLSIFGFICRNRCWLRTRIRTHYINVRISQCSKSYLFIHIFFFSYFFFFEITNTKSVSHISWICVQREGPSDVWWRMIIMFFFSSFLFDFSILAHFIQIAHKRFCHRHRHISAFIWCLRWVCVAGAKKKSRSTNKIQNSQHFKYWCFCNSFV